MGEKEGGKEGGGERGSGGGREGEREKLALSFVKSNTLTVSYVSQ